ncbi:MAG: phospho-sugar mutase [bacterium]|nr:phospho-sugar mutase [bacterium]
MSDDPGLRAAAEAWSAADPDPGTRAELETLLASAGADAGATEDLRRLFGERLRFGTAGLRAPLGTGPARMNRVTVRSATAAVMATLPAGARVVIGHDARRNSDVFAGDVAAFVAAAGGEALFLGQAPTPVAAHAVVDRGADAAIVITASHNPPEDNGYKLYDAGGAQIVPPADAAVEAHMAAAPLPPRDAPAPSGGGAITEIGPEAIERYLADIAGRLAMSSQPGSPLRVVYTPLHGVGAALLGALFERLGLPAPAVVGSQAEPDGSFPTLTFPNPEEPGALDAAYETADRTGADLIIANDPDADRLAVAVPSGDGWRRLTGDELGALLADCLLRRRAAGGSPEPVLLAASVVSSQLLESMAADAGVAHAETLTGFKWIARAADGRPERLLFGYEEALGYAVCDAVRDKDGISAAALAVQLAGELRAAGSSLLERLDDLHRRHGVHATGQVTVRFPPAQAAAGPAEITARLREEPPAEIAGRLVASLIDYMAPSVTAASEPPAASGRRDEWIPASAGMTNEQTSNEQTSGPSRALPPTDMLAFGLTGGDRVIVRPSGTEPKLKVYIETVEAATGDDLAAARRRAESRRDLLAEGVRALISRGQAAEPTARMGRSRR